MNKSDRDDRWRPEIVDDESVPLPEPWFLRDLRNRNAQAEAERVGIERRSLPSNDELNLYRRHDDSPPPAEPPPLWRRWWPLGAGAAVLFAVLVLVLFVPPRVDGASTPVTIGPEPSSVVQATAPAPAPAPAAASVGEQVEPAPAADPTDQGATSETTTVGSVLAAAPDSNPSFDCENVASRVNKMICASPELGALDRQLATRHAEVAQGLDRDARADLEDSRAEFLRHKMRCDDEACIARIYEDGMAELNEFAESVGQP